MHGLAPLCPYCGNFSVHSTGAELYAHRYDLADKQFYRCIPCEAWVGVHVMTGAPLGTLANSRLRKLRTQVHKEFDPIWSMPAHRKWASQLKNVKPKPLAYFIPRFRTQAYEQLAQIMDISVDLCHIAMFNEDQCQRALQILNTGVINLR